MFHVRSQTKIGPDWFSRLDVHGIQTDSQIDRWVERRPHKEQINKNLFELLKMKINNFFKYVIGQWIGVQMTVVQTFSN